MPSGLLRDGARWLCPGACDVHGSGPGPLAGAICSPERCFAVRLSAAGVEAGGIFKSSIPRDPTAGWWGCLPGRRGGGGGRRVPWGGCRRARGPACCRPPAPAGRPGPCSHQPGLGPGAWAWAWAWLAGAGPVAQRPMVPGLGGRGPPGKHPPFRQSRRVRISRVPTNPLGVQRRPEREPIAGGSHSASANQPSLLASLSSPRLSQSKSAAIIPFQPPGFPPIAAGAVSDGQSAPLLPRRHLCGGAAAAGRRDDGGGGGRWRVRHFRCQVAAAAERSGGRGRAWGCGRRRPPRRPRGHG